MATRKSSPGSTRGSKGKTEVEPTEGDGSASVEPAKPTKVTKRAGGHELKVDRPTPTPKREPLCSQHGHNCPGHKRSGGQVAKFPPTPKREPTCSMHGRNCPGHEDSGGWQLSRKDD